MKNLITPQTIFRKLPRRPTTHNRIDNLSTAHNPIHLQPSHLTNQMLFWPFLPHVFVYADYEQLSSICREKLQIEYDLQELEMKYKREKSSSTADETLLIETRRQIEAFRLELLKHKETVWFLLFFVVKAEATVCSATL